jgi:hypothetical protein
MNKEAEFQIGEPLYVCRIGIMEIRQVIPVKEAEDFF